MADIADWSSSVVIQSGSVTILGTANVAITNTPSVTVTGTPNVNIANTPAVTVNSGTINIGNTPTVILGAGTASVGSISAIGSTVTVAGTINIGNTPSVTISGTPNVNISSGTVNIGTTPGPSTITAGPSALGALNAAVTVSTGGLTGAGMLLAAGTLAATLTPEVSMDGGTTWTASQFMDPATGANASSLVVTNPNGVAMRSILCPPGTTNARVRVSAYTSGTANATVNATVANSVYVLIGGTPTVNIGNTPSVSISGTPSVTIASGTVSISGTPNINITSQSTTLNVNQPQTALADLVFPNGTSTQTTATVPAGTHALQLTFTGSFTSFAVKGHQTLIQYAPQDAGSIGAASFPPNPMVWVIPVNSVQDTTYDCVATQGTGGNVTVKVSAILDSQAVWVQSTKVNPVWVADVGAITETGAFARGRASIIPEYDASGTNTAAVGNQSTVTLAASAGKAYHAHAIDGTCLATTANAGGQAVQLLDGAAVIASWQCGVANVIGSTTRVGGPDYAFIGTVNTAMTLKFTAGTAGNLESVNLGAYLRS